MAFVDLDRFLERFVSILPPSLHVLAKETQDSIQHSELLDELEQLKVEVRFALEEEEEEEEEEDEEEGLEALGDGTFLSDAQQEQLPLAEQPPQQESQPHRRTRTDSSGRRSREPSSKDQLQVASGSRKAQPASPGKRKSSKQHAAHLAEEAPAAVIPVQRGPVKLLDVFGNNYNSWRFCDWSNLTTPQQDFKVRYPPNYKVNGFKKISEEPLYDVVAFGGLFTPKKLEGIYRYLDVENNPLFQEPALDLPLVTSFHLLLPLYAPGIWSKGDGAGLSAVAFAVLNERGRRLAALPKEKQPPVVKLTKMFMQALHQEDVKLAERFKIFAVWTNFEEHVEKLPSMLVPLIRGGFGKPFLTRPQHKFWFNSKFLGCELDAHIFGYTPRLLWHSTKGMTKVMTVTIAVTLEGHLDDELPENTMWQLSANNVDVSEEGLCTQPKGYQAYKEPPPMFNRI
eukprot:gb/GEZN01003948.1/.p1 GENE.gb/GEZN01003948.1/~~gb/GEZN01003948.1/.p1  ORF type:complete len:454 (+),score=111.59 gb/GEZN01003948.1/:140-1501(+)